MFYNVNMSFESIEAVDWGEEEERVLENLKFDIPTLPVDFDIVISDIRALSPAKQATVAAEMQRFKDDIRETAGLSEEDVQAMIAHWRTKAAENIKDMEGAMKEAEAEDLLMHIRDTGGNGAMLATIVLDFGTPAGRFAAQTLALYCARVLMQRPETKNLEVSKRKKMQLKLAQDAYSLLFSAAEVHKEGDID
jgi:hypothetical protein